MQTIYSRRLSDTGQTLTQRYTAEIHRYFLSRCGKTAVLTIADWSCIQQWREIGIPAECVFKGIDRAFERNAGAVTSLIHCTWAIKEVCRDVCGSIYVD